MGSSSEFAGGPGTPAASEESDGDEPAAAATDGGFDELRRQSAAMLQTLADKYDSESEDSRSRSARLLAESETAGDLAVKLAEESVRIRTEADRLAAEPTWMTGVPEVASESTEQAVGSTGSGTWSSSATPGETSGATATETASTGSAGSGTAPQPGPGPARGFAPNAGSEGSESSDPGSASASDDWAPRPFESWRNQASQVTSRRLEL